LTTRATAALAAASTVLLRDYQSENRNSEVATEAQSHGEQQGFCFLCASVPLWLIALAVLLKDGAARSGPIHEPR
jgi:hypothetical protein